MQVLTVVRTIFINVCCVNVSSRPLLPLLAAHRDIGGGVHGLPGSCALHQLAVIQLKGRLCGGKGVPQSITG